MKDLFFYYDKNLVINDLSRKMQDFLRDDFALNVTAAEDCFYIGLYKPFNGIYFELSIQSIVEQEFTYEYYNGAGFSSLNVFDDTNGLQRSGFLQWEKPSDWQSSQVGNQEAYWIKVSFASDFDVTIAGCNLVFADDNDLQQEIRDIQDYKAVGDKSFIAYHVSSRNDIVQSLRNGGYRKTENTNTIDETFANITKWDILDLGEIRQAAKYLCLSKIFFDVSENVDDKAFTKFKEYQSMYGKAFDLFYLSIDKDDDGQVDNITENLSDNEIQVYKL